MQGAFCHLAIFCPSVTQEARFFLTEPLVRELQVSDMAENQLLDTFYQMMPKSLGNGQSCNNLATDLISLQHSIPPSLVLSFIFLFFSHSVSVV